MKLYENLAEIIELYKKNAARFAEKKDAVRRIKVGDKPLVDLIEEAVEESVNELSGQMLTVEKEKRWNLLVMMSNTARTDICFAQCISRDIQGLLQLFYPKYSSELSKLLPNQYEAAIIVAASEIKELIEKYWANPAKEPSEEYYQQLRAKRATVTKKKGFFASLFGKKDDDGC